MKRFILLSVLLVTAHLFSLSSCSPAETQLSPSDILSEQTVIYGELSQLFADEGYAEALKPATFPSSLIPTGYISVHASYDREGRIFSLQIPVENPDCVCAVLCDGDRVVKEYTIPGEASEKWKVILCDGGYIVIQDLELRKCHVLDSSLFNVYDVDMWSSQIDSLTYNAALDKFIYTPVSSASIIMSDTDFLDQKAVYTFEYPYSSPSFLAYSSDYTSIILSVTASESDVNTYCSFNINECSAVFQGVSNT